MNELIILIIIIMAIILCRIILGVNKKKILEIAENKKLNKITENLPDNLGICKEILRKLKNENIKIEEDNNTNCFYFIATNKIILNKDKQHFTRVQTIAHECLHSMQNKKILWFNYIFSNLFNLFWITILLLTAFGIIKNYIFYISILLILTLIFYSVRSYLEIDAMVKAKYIAKEYLEDKKVKEVDEIINEYEKLNNIGIRYICYYLISSKLYLLLIYTIVSLIRIFLV